MTENAVHRFEHHARLTRALEQAFGPWHSWSLATYVAHAQLRLLRDHIGSDNYAQVIDIAYEAASSRLRASGLGKHTHIDHLSRAYCRRRATDGSAHEVGWAILYGLNVLLSAKEYESVVFAASRACAALVVGS
jgi:hypothetical protein